MGEIILSVVLPGMVPMSCGELYLSKFLLSP